MGTTPTDDLRLEPAAVDRMLATGQAAPALASWVRDRAPAELRKGRGYVVIVGADHLSLDDAKRYLMLVSRLFGAVMPQDYLAEEVREIRDRGMDITTSRSARYSDTRFGGHLHTDGMHRPGHIPDYFTLYCHRSARDGGESVLVVIDDLLDRLRQRPGILATLEGEFHFDSRDTSGRGPRTVPRPILESTADGISINYIREYVESGHAVEGVPPLTAEQRAALDAVDEALADPALHRHIRLRRSDLMIIHNRRLVHGRTDFVDHDDPGKRRLLLRTWIDAR
ncbi:TauD/TfdA family dioxygenase [Salinispora pacifica]|uniref:TauD/TfdA family dioxygenase n=1 Tax=Salinispora pacifica TaxID=351187 RepID=UPI00047F1771|nr:TauD/TfdA family dioxygenase [Salinispora pacifica]